jgi:hypothetical protein
VSSSYSVSKRGLVGILKPDIIYDYLHLLIIPDCRQKCRGSHEDELQKHSYALRQDFLVLNNTAHCSGLPGNTELCGQTTSSAFATWVFAYVNTNAGSMLRFCPKMNVKVFCRTISTTSLLDKWTRCAAPQSQQGTLCHLWRPAEAWEKVCRTCTGNEAF